MNRPILAVATLATAMAAPSAARADVTELKWATEGYFPTPPIPLTNLAPAPGRERGGRDEREPSAAPGGRVRKGSGHLLPREFGQQALGSDRRSDPVPDRADHDLPAPRQEGHGRAPADHRLRLRQAQRVAVPA